MPSFFSFGSFGSILAQVFALGQGILVCGNAFVKEVRKMAFRFRHISALYYTFGSSEPIIVKRIIFKLCLRVDS